MSTRIQLYDFDKLWHDNQSKILSSINLVGYSGKYILSKQVSSFESDLAAKVNVNYATACGNGLEAIQLSLMSLKLPQNSLILTTPLSAYATTLAIIHNLHTPIFVDTDTTGNINLDLVIKALNKYKNKVSCFVPVYLYGQALDLDKLTYIRKRFNIKIVLDVAQAIGTNLPNVRTNIFDLATLSFYPTKNLGALGDGGAILTNRYELSNKLKILRNYGQSTQYNHLYNGLNSRLDEIQASILKEVFLPKLHQVLKQKKLIANQYIQQIKHPKVIIPQLNPNASTWHIFPLIVKQNRNKFRLYLANHDIETAIHYPKLIPYQKAMHNTKHLVEGVMDQAMYVSKHEVSLPIHPYLSIKNIDTITNTINQWH